MAAPGAMVAYALLGTSRSLVVSATTATSALSAAAIGPLAGGDTARFALLSAGLAIITAGVLVAAGLLRLGRVTDFVSKAVMTGFLFGLGLTVALAQVSKLLGLPETDGNFFAALGELLGQLGDVHGLTLAVGAGSVVLLLVLRELAPRAPGTLIVLVLAIVVSALFGFADRGVDVVGDLPRAVPDLAWPTLSWADVAALLPAAFGVLVITAEAVGVSRGIATADGYTVDPNRDLVAMGASNLIAGMSSGFVQSGGASQTMAADQAGGRTQLTSVVAAVLIVLTGAFLSFLFTDLPQATLGAIVIVAISGFWDIAELQRIARLQTVPFVLALVALVGVLVAGVLPGLLIAAGLSLFLLIRRLSRPQVDVMGRDAATGAWRAVERDPDVETSPGVLTVRVEGPLFYANAETAKDGILDAVTAADRPVEVVVLDMGATEDLDVTSLDILGELVEALTDKGIRLELASVRAKVGEMLDKGGVAQRVTIWPTLDAAAETHRRS